MTRREAREVTLKIRALVGFGVNTDNGLRWACPACHTGRNDPLLSDPLFAQFAHRPLIFDARGLRCDACGAQDDEVKAAVEREFNLEHLKTEIEVAEDRASTAEYLLGQETALKEAALARAHDLQMQLGDLEGARRRNDEVVA